MSIRPNSMANQFEPRRGRIATCFIVGLTLMFLSMLSKTAVAAPEDEVRSAFDHFVAAQNAHDVKAVDLCCWPRRTSSGLPAAHRSGV